MKKTIAIIILIIICLGLGGYIAYDKLYAEKEVEKEPIEEKEITITVEDGLVLKSEKEYKEGFNEKIDVVLPKVLVNGKESETVKEKIENGTEEKMRELLDEVEANTNYDNPDWDSRATATYDYVINGNVVMLYIDAYVTRKLPTWFVDEFVFYDAKNDKLLSWEEGFKAVGYTLEDLKNIAANNYSDMDDINTFEDLFVSPGCGLQIDKIVDHKTIEFSAYYCE